MTSSLLSRCRLVQSVWLMLLCSLWKAGAAAEPAQLRPWRDYRTIMWVGDSASKHPEKLPLFFQRLKEMGVNTAMVYDDGDLRPVLDNQFPYYVENIINRGLCLKFNSQVRDWDKFVTTWAKEGRPEAALVRDYCLDDPQWRSWARREMETVVRKNKDHNPLAYDIRDELSTTFSANPFDYDFNPIALAQFRNWLRAQYGELAQLNKEWETDFRSWDEVKPFTTDQIKNRMASGDALPRGQPDWQAVARLKFEPTAARQSPTRWNLSPWVDFRTYMDHSLAAALDDIRAAAHQADPRTPVGIEGTQMPDAFGGYDLQLLSSVLDWVEPYDIGNAREIFGSFMPDKPIVTTVFENDTPHARRRLWHLLLEGDRGCIVWWSEDCLDWNSPDYALTAKAKALAPVVKEMTSPLAQLFLRARREYDPIFIHYSQPSIQVDWLLESTIDGSTWLRRFSSFEADHNQMARVRNDWLKAFQDLGYSPRFVTGEELAGDLQKEPKAVVVLPGSLALSEREITALHQFHNAKSSEAVHRVFCSGTPGAFDEHGKLRSGSRLEDIFPDEPSAFIAQVASNDSSARPPAIDMGQYERARLQPPATNAWAEWIRTALGPLEPEITVPLSARVRVHRYAVAKVRLLAFERNADYHMSEDLKQAGGNEALERPAEFEARWQAAAHIYDLRTGKYLGRAEHLRVMLDPWQPALFALSTEPLAGEDIVSRLLQQLP